MTKIFSNVLAPGPGCAAGVPVPVPDPVPKYTRLYQNVPNPFNPTTTIQFDLAHDGPVTLRIFDVAGHRVRTLLDGKLAGNRHQVTWNGLDDTGRRVASGVYLYRLTAQDLTATRRLVLLK